MSLRDIYDSVTEKIQSVLGAAPPEAKTGAKPDPLLDDMGPPPGTANILLCQDSTSVHANAQGIAEALRKKGYDMQVTCVHDQGELVRHLEKLRKNGGTPPDGVFMDVCGVGESAALKVIDWFDKNHPDKPLPALNFLSLDLGMAITEAGRLRDSDARVPAGFVDPGEVSWLQQKLEREKPDYGAPDTTTFRDFLIARLGVKLPMNVNKDSYYAEQMKKVRTVTNDRVLDAWQRGKITPEDALERMRAYATGVAAALQQGLYGQNGKTEGITQDATFYSNAGFPMKGKAVFSLDAAENAYYNDYDHESSKKPVLFMQSYDPAVVPLLASGHLGGLVVTSPYMASHLKVLCETHMVSGLFGMIPPGETLTSEFNEEARPDAPPYFEGETATIAGVKVREGQDVLVGVGGNGLCLKPPKVSASAEAKADAASIERDDKLKNDVRNLKQLDRCFASYFAGKGQTPHGVKANVDSGNARILRNIKGIGLVRTEQMVATDSSQVEYLKQILLSKNEREEKDAYHNFFYYAKYSYRDLLQQLNENKPVKIRLFDFVHREILTPDEQKQFTNRYGKIDIHGGEALKTWPELYRGQVRSIFEALHNAEIFTNVPLEIMMPAVKTEADTLEVKKIVTEEAQKAGIKPSQYSYGVMIETLESCANISAIARHIDFVSFGTNDLTSEYFDMSRSDLKAHAGFAAKNGYDPFKKMAPEILSIVRDVIAKGRAVNPSLKMDVCGAQAADPAAAETLYTAGIDNVSVAPSLSNLYALPVLLNYKAFDALKAKEPAPPAPANTNVPEAPKPKASAG